MAETIPASRKLGREEAANLAKAARRIVIARGKKYQSFDGTPEVVDRMLGPTGNLRAPTMRVGKVVVVGFHEEPYREVLG